MANGNGSGVGHGIGIGIGIAVGMIVVHKVWRMVHRDLEGF